MRNLWTVAVAAALGMSLIACGPTTDAAESPLGKNGGGRSPSVGVGGGDPDTSVGATVVPDDEPDDGWSPPPADPPASLTDKARTALAAHLKVDQADVKLVSGRQQVWDAGLGCGQPGKAYAEIGLYGYLLTLQSGDQQYTVHSDQLGNLMILCQGGSPTLLVGSELP